MKRSQTDGPAGKYPLADALEWGWSRHRLVASTAESQIQSSNAKKAISQKLSILIKNNMADISTWADTVKKWREPKPTDDSETKKFFEDKRNAKNREWHYVDLPLGVSGYDRQKYPEFTRDNDVVQIINICILVLLGKLDRFSEPNALRLLVHLVGDVHQPLHAGCCYISESDGSHVPTLVTDPVQASRLESDHGGNRLILDLDGGKDNLHSFWDNGFSQEQKKGRRSKPLAEQGDAPWLSESVKKRSYPSAVGNINTWAAQWATESLKPAQDAYESVSIAEPYGEDDYLVSWEGKDSYIKRNKKALDEQLSRAGHNLAVLLDTIWP